MIRAVVFDLDGVIIESEEIWDEVRRGVAIRYGGRWQPDSTGTMQGMNTSQWSRYLHNVVGVDLRPEEIVEAVVGELLDRYRQHLPVLPGAVEAVRALAGRVKLAVASSSPRRVIGDVLGISALAGDFDAVVSSDEVAAGKPAPDVYLEAARRLHVPPGDCAAVEDSANGIRSARNASMTVVAVPNRRYPPPDEVLALADVVLQSLKELPLSRLDVRWEPVDPNPRPPGDEARREERLDEAEVESFPASDPHSDWAGPSEPD
jgi:HAD superfamily hydrolase (TIGR01509 family)